MKFQDIYNNFKKTAVHVDFITLPQQSSNLKISEETGCTGNILKKMCSHPETVLFKGALTFIPLHTVFPY